MVFLLGEESNKSSFFDYSLGSGYLFATGCDPVDSVSVSLHREETTERKQSKRFLECVEDNFLTQLVSEPAKEGTLLGLFYANREGLVGDVVFGGCFGYSDWLSILKK